LNLLNFFNSELNFYLFAHTNSEFKTVGVKCKSVKSKVSLEIRRTKRGNFGSLETSWMAIRYFLNGR
jgi:hypothetical protein